jgi:hypothetical protein
MLTIVCVRKSRQEMIQQARTIKKIIEESGGRKVKRLVDE